MNLRNWQDTFSSVGKAIEVSATAVAKTGYSIASNELSYCHCCKVSISAAQLSLNLVTYEKCRICTKSHCGKCIIKHSMSIPADTLHEDFRISKEKDANISWICLACEPIAKSRWLQEFRSIAMAEIEERLNTYYSNSETLQLFFELPSPSKDTLTRKAQRFAQLAEVVADMAGYSMTFKAIKYAYYSRELYALLIAGEILNVLGPVVTELERLGATTMGTKGVLQLYYLSCQHKLDHKIDPTTEFSSFLDESQLGLISSDCSEELLDSVGNYMDVAQWLYVAGLPRPHHKQDWSRWYLTNLVRRQGWTVVASINDTTKLVNDRKCPAFSLMVRSLPGPDSASTSEANREALLVVRGSQSVMDWSINLNEDPTEFIYSTGPSHTNTVRGFVHAGMYEGALGILDDYGIRAILYSLIKRGYVVTVVGHSLGAGTAALVAAEFKNGALKLVADSGLSIPSIKAVCLATPACVTENLADAFVADGICTTIVNGFDIVPRFSKANMIGMVVEIKATESRSEHWYKEDYADLKEYVSSMGKAGDAISLPMNPTVSAAAAAAATSTASASESSVAVTAVPPLSTTADANSPSEAPAQTPPPDSGASIAATASAFSKMAVSFYNSKVAAPAVASPAAPATATVIATPSSATPVTGSPVVVVAQSTPMATATVVSVSSTPATTATTTTQEGRVVPPPKPAKMVRTPSQIGAELDPVTVSPGEEVAAADGGQGVVEPVQVTGTYKTLVPPGRLIHLYNAHGEYRAAEITHQHSSLKRIILLDDRSIADHNVNKMTDVIRRIKLRYVNKRGGLVMQSPPIWQGIRRKPFSEVDSAASDPTGIPSVSDTTAAAASDSTGVSTTSTTKATTDNVDIDDSFWTKCCVCRLDPTWLYILKGDANRGHVVHNCRSCGKVACTMCASAGDNINGDGIRSKVLLTDYKIPLPALGLLEPQRVCMHCYFESYKSYSAAASGSSAAK